jgi:hypothetical protein
MLKRAFDFRTVALIARRCVFASDVRVGCAPWKGGAFQWVQAPPGNRSSREATGAVMEETKWLKPSVSVSRIGDSASVQAVTQVNAEQALEKDNAQADPTTLSGKADTAG